MEMLTDSSAVIHVPQDEAARVIGKAGKNIDQIEKNLGLHIDVRTQDAPVLALPRWRRRPSISSSGWRAWPESRWRSS